MVRAITGCDFITPHNFKKLPNCKFCNEIGVGWKHLLFICPKRDCDAFITDIRAKLESFDDASFAGAVASNSLRLLDKLCTRKAFDGLINFAFGICCTDTKDEIVPLKFQKVLCAVMEVTSKHVADIHGKWFTPE